MGASTFTPVVDKFRFYEDGTESGSTPIAAEDTNLTNRSVNSDSKVHVRYRIQETGGKAGNANDDWRLQFQINAGGFANVTTTSTGVQVDTGSSLTDGSATTNRATNGITDGTGSFVASQQEEGDGEITNFQLTASNFTEALWAIKLVSASLSNADVIQFRVTLNAGTPGVTNSVTPQITVAKQITATLSNTEADDSISSAGVLLIQASSTQTEAADAIAAAGVLTIAATVGITEAADTIAATGTIADASITADASIAEAADTVASAGALPIAADSGISEAADTIAAAGALAIAADAGIAEADDSIASAGALGIVAAAGITEAADSITSAAALAIAADSGISEAADSIASTGDTGAGEIIADAAVAEADDSVAAAAALEIVATAGITEAGDSIVAALVDTGVVAQPGGGVWPLGAYYFRQPRLGTIVAELVVREQGDACVARLVVADSAKQKRTKKMCRNLARWI